jgi:hypothetical protein
MRSPARCWRTSPRAKIQIDCLNGKGTFGTLGREVFRNATRVHSKMRGEFQEQLATKRVVHAGKEIAIE